jgi:hypothetical protein
MPEIKRLSHKPTPKISRPASSAPAIWQKITPVDTGEDSGIKILLYGKSGSGKTTLWSTFPQPILVMLCSGGNKTGELRSISKEAREQTRQIVINSMEEAGELLDYIIGLEASGSKERPATVVVDHITGLQDLILKEILCLESIPVQKSWGLATQQDYGQCAMKCKELLRKLLDLQANSVIIAQERQFKGRDDDAREGNLSLADYILPSIGAALSESTANWLHSAVDYSCHTFLRQKEVPGKPIKLKKNGKEVLVPGSPRKVPGEVEYCLRTGPHAVYMTKFRKSIEDTVPPKVIVDPTYQKILEILR